FASLAMTKNWEARRNRSEDGATCSSSCFCLPADRLRPRAPVGDTIDDVALAHLAAGGERDLIELQEELGHVVFRQAGVVQMPENVLRARRLAGPEHHRETHA